MFSYIDASLLKQWWLGLTAPQQAIFRQIIEVELAGTQKALNNFPGSVEPHEFKANMVALQTAHAKLTSLLQNLDTINSEATMASQVT